MANELEKTELKNKLVDSFAAVERAGERIVGLIQGAKNTVTQDKATINSATLITAEEKTEWSAEYDARMLEVKTAIESALN